MTLGCDAAPQDPVAQNGDDPERDASTEKKDSSAKDSSKTDTSQDNSSPPETDSEAGGGCGAANCAGCCTIEGLCVDGLAHTQCGRQGEPCTDCTADDSRCETNGACCEPVCVGRVCGDANGCGGICGEGSGCCVQKCSDKICGDPDECGGTCVDGSGCCTPHCVGAVRCGTADDCGGTCDGVCDNGFFCNAQHSCECGPAPDFGVDFAGVCRPSCARFVADRFGNWVTSACCPATCQNGVLQAAYDCPTMCCLADGTCQ